MCSDVVSFNDGGNVMKAVIHVLGLVGWFIFGFGLSDYIFTPVEDPMPISVVVSCGILGIVCMIYDIYGELNGNL